MGCATICRKTIDPSKSDQGYCERCRFNNKFLKGRKNLNRHLALNFKPSKVFFLCYQNKSDEFWQAQEAGQAQWSFVFRGRFPDHLNKPTSYQCSIRWTLVRPKGLLKAMSTQTGICANSDLAAFFAGARQEKTKAKYRMIKVEIRWGSLTPKF